MRPSPPPRNTATMPPPSHRRPTAPTPRAVVAATFLSLESAVTRPVTFWIYGSCAGLGLVVLSFFMPETAKKKLEDMEAIFAPATAPQPTSST